MAVFECADVDEYVFGARRGSDEAVGFLLVPVSMTLCCGATPLLIIPAIFKE